MTDETCAYADWIKNLIKTCLPIELQKKILTLAPLTKQEAEKFAHAVQLAAQARSLAKQDELSAKLDRNTERILRAIRNENEKPFDKRSPQERQLIDRAALHYVRRHFIEGLDIPKSDCIRHIWKKHGDETVFRDYSTFSNAVRYDLDRFYDLDVLIARAKTEHPI